MRSAVLTPKDNNIRYLRYLGDMGIKRFRKCRSTKLRDETLNDFVLRKSNCVDLSGLIHMSGVIFFYIMKFDAKTRNLIFLSVLIKTIRNEWRVVVRSSEY